MLKHKSLTRSHVVHTQVLRILQPNELAGATGGGTRPPPTGDDKTSPTFGQTDGSTRVI
jgi:hypothetical protein